MVSKSDCIFKPFMFFFSSTAGNMETSASIEDDDKEDIGMTCSTHITDGCGLVQDSSPNPPVAISEDRRSLPVSPSTLSSPVSTALHNHYHINSRLHTSLNIIIELHMVLLHISSE